MRASSASSAADVSSGSAGASGLCRRVSVLVIRLLCSVVVRDGRRAVIVGVATSDYPSLPDLSEHQVHAQAADRALADAGLTYADVDGYATAGFAPMYAVQMCEYLGLRPVHIDETNIGGAS